MISENLNTINDTEISSSEKNINLSQEGTYDNKN